MWYVYRYVDPTNERVFYIGKGQGNRSKVHLYRARTWVKRGKPTNCGSHNFHLLRLISKIWDCGHEPLVEIVERFEEENDAYAREKSLIAEFRESLCNLTDGGEGWTGTDETRKKMGEKRKEWLASEAGMAWRSMMSESRRGDKNPNYGKVEDEEHKRARMKNMLEKERWNKGMSGDPRCKGHAKGEITHNAKSCIATHEATGETVTAESVNRLCMILANHRFKISGSSIKRIVNKDRTINGWRIKHVVSGE